MGLVHDHQVERHRGGLGGEVGVLGEPLLGHDREAALRERLAWATEFGDALRGEQGEERVELVEQLRQPLKGKVLRNDHQHAFGKPQLAHAGEDQACLDRLAEAHLVREDEPRDSVREDATRCPDLVRQHVDAGGKQRAETVGSSQRFEPRHPSPKGERARGAGVAGREPVEKTAGRPIERRVVGDGDERGVAARDDGDSLAPREADGDPATVLCHLHHETDAPCGLGAVNEFLALLPSHWLRVLVSLPVGGGQPFKARTSRALGHLHRH